MFYNINRPSHPNLHWILYIQSSSSNLLLIKLLSIYFFHVVGRVPLPRIPGSPQLVILHLFLESILKYHGICHNIPNGKPCGVGSYGVVFPRSICSSLDIQHFVLKISISTVYILFKGVITSKMYLIV